MSSIHLYSPKIHCFVKPFELRSHIVFILTDIICICAFCQVLCSLDRFPLAIVAIENNLLTAMLFILFVLRCFSQSFLSSSDTSAFVIYNFILQDKNCFFLFILLWIESFYLFYQNSLCALCHFSIQSRFFVPGYTGHVQGYLYRHGDTYAKATRSTILSTIYSMFLSFSLSSVILQV